jgi:hypothetical protein
MGRTKAKRRKKARGDPAVHFKVRLTREEAMELMELAGDALDLAEQRVHMIRPRLSPEARKEVALRCSDPKKHGGIETGNHPETGDYVDVAVTTAER